MDIELTLIGFRMSMHYRILAKDEFVYSSRTERKLHVTSILNKRSADGRT